jgi:adenosylmethionine-8-amino-7-oxononanoate aminotransferase
VAELRQTGMSLAIGAGQGQAASTPLPLAGAPRALRLCPWAVTRGGVAAFSYFMPAYVITEDEIRLMAEVATESIERATAE